jgi:hypothetical protein
MKNPATFSFQPTTPLDADLRRSGFPYSTLDRPVSGEKAQPPVEAGSTAALDPELSRKVEIPQASV